MKMKCAFLYSTLILAFFSCHADPGIISDDDSIPSIPGGTPLMCDSLQIPNEFFPHQMNEVLVFTDSLGSTFDTLIFTDNEAWSEKITQNSSPAFEQCVEHYVAAYRTNWLPSTDVYFIEFEIIKSVLSTYNAQSVPQEDFFASFRVPSPSNQNQFDSLVINGQVYREVDLYQCLSSKPCQFLENLATAKGLGLVAFKRNGEWWNKN